jgi:hypothetical protein
MQLPGRCLHIAYFCLRLSGGWEEPRCILSIRIVLPRHLLPPRKVRLTNGSASEDKQYARQPQVCGASAPSATPDSGGVQYNRPYAPCLLVQICPAYPENYAQSIHVEFP